MTAGSDPKRAAPAAVIVDGNELMRRVVGEVLRSHRPEFTIVEAHDGETAVELVRQWRAILVLMEIQLPGINGLEATRRIKESMADCMVILMSWTEEEDFVRLTREAGAAALLRKDTVATTLAPLLSTLPGLDPDPG
ncbi:MAG: response regulator transcription factor [Betaproteobacteria bacterium]